MRTVALHLAELGFALAVLAGVALIYAPAALILGGLAGVVAVERALARLSPARRKENR
ncbi:hypothetical protein OG481_09770 [Streptomyces longwoodensis]|uniref:hypothetical protein n=1 Tax=Streptomyces longwoodensis TaxID=68231 RepID=UPI002DD8A9EC|nr:hypothetical protein [Streptomyces longwoodensis]WRY88804.1 hypothetical protein OG481_09770 [Streptomyces longwoodensis]